MPNFKTWQSPGDILAAGYNFGSGSSREQAATALEYRGIRLVLAASFSETYKRNALNNGYLVMETPELIDDLKEKFGTARLSVATELAATGKVRFIGVSNFSVAELQRARRAMRKHPIVSNQVRYNLSDRAIEGELLPYCQVNGVTVIAYSPLGRAFGRIPDCDPHGILEKVARESGRTVHQVALNWCLRQAGVVAMPKGSSIAHVLENCGASGWRLTTEQIRRLDEGIVFRRRSRAETMVRKMIPHAARQFVRRIAGMLPPAIRHRLS